MECIYCNKSFKNEGGLGAHIKTCERITALKSDIIDAYSSYGIGTISRKFNIGNNTALHIIKDSGIKLRTRDESIKLSHSLYPEKFKHSDETKYKMRIKRLDWMKANPDKTAWRTRNNPSYPELLFIKICNELNLVSIYDIVREYSVHPYFIDFAFTNANVAIEVDGSQHWLNADRVTCDIAKDELLRTKGWRIMRIPAFKIQNSYNEIKTDLINFLNDISITEKLYNNDIIEYEQIKEAKRNNKLIKKSNKQSVKLHIVNSRKIEFDAIYPHIGWTMQLAKKWNMTSQAVGRYCRKHYGIGTEHIRLTRDDILNSFSKNLNLTDISKLYGISSSTVSDYCKKYNIEIPKYVVKVDWKTIDLHELLKTKTGAQIAKELDVTPSSVYNQIKKLGLIV